MKIFRRSQALGFEAPGAHPAAEPQSAAKGTTGRLPRQDTGPILVAVDGRADGWDALEWAAAEAAARDCALRIVHAVRWPPLAVDRLGPVPVNQQDAAAPEAAERIVSEAARRACIVAPAIQITTHLQAGETAAAVLREGSQDALIVLGRGRKAARFSPVTRSLGWQLARRASCPVTMVELFDEASRGPSAGRVVVAVDGTAEPTAALGFAFRAALRRGVGITMLHAWSHDLGAQADDQAAADSFSCCAVEDALRMCRDVFPEVEVRQRYVAGPAGRALAAESAAAALVVLGSRAHGRLHRAIFGSVEHAVLRSARCPVAIVRTPPAGGQQLSGHGGGCW